MERNERILIVDDEESVLNMLRLTLQIHGYECMGALDTAEARRRLEEKSFDLILCDVNMPGESGLDLARYAINVHKDTAVIMVTAVDDPGIAKIALDLGVYGYIIKPFRPIELTIHVANALRRRELEIHDRRHREDLERLVAERTERLQLALNDLHESLEGTIGAMAATLESRDPYTAGHQQRVAELSCAIAREIAFPNERLDGVRMAAMIHDLGKISVPAEILSKPGRLTDLEFNLIKMHPQVGYNILKTVRFPWPVAQMILQHHEKLDGSGYPQGLSGGEILLEARILGVADVVEAMASHRPYRPALGIEAAIEEISKNRGVLYDVTVVDACVNLLTEKGFEFR
jgi:putative two-component system response regulator